MSVSRTSAALLAAAAVGLLLLPPSARATPGAPARGAQVGVADPVGRLGVGFTSPVYVDTSLAGGEPTVAYASKSGLLVYTSHEGTTHLFSSAIPLAPAESGPWIANYRNQVNIWTSADRGATWKPVNYAAGFFTNPALNTGFSDPDLTEDEAGNLYNTGIDLANDALFSSQDGGRTWPTGTPQCHEGDRPWLAGGKAGEVFLATDSDNPSGHYVFHSTDKGASCSSTSIPDAGTADGERWTGDGKLFYDHLRGALVEPTVYGGGSVTGVGVSILADASNAFGSKLGSFSPVHVAKTTMAAHWPAIAIDRAGNYYEVWDTNDRDPSPEGCPGTDSGSETFGSTNRAHKALANSIMMASSTDGGHTWSAPVTVAHHAGHRVLWPWITAGSAGNVGVVWYEYDGLTDPDCGTGKVSVMATRITNATSADPSVDPVVDAAGRPIHDGAVCQGGTACAGTGGVTGEDRRLGDYFTVGLDPDGCMLVATGDTTRRDAVTGQPSPISHGIFLRQNAGPGLTGIDCATGLAVGSVTALPGGLTAPQVKGARTSARGRLPATGGERAAAPVAVVVLAIAAAIRRVARRHAVKVTSTAGSPGGAANTR